MASSRAMEELHVHEDDEPDDSSPSTNGTGPRSSKLKSRSDGAVFLCLGLLSVFLLARLISFFVFYHNSVGGSAADLSTIKADLTERLRASEDKLSSVSEERDLLNANLTNLTQEKDRLQRLSTNLNQEMDRRQRLCDQNHNSEDGSAADLSTIKADLTERLRASEDKLSSVSEERDLLQTSLTNLIEEMDRLQRLCNQKKTCPEGWRMFRCSCYLLSTRTGSWEESRKDCRDKGADLVIIDSLEEQKFLLSIITNRTWIGLSDGDEEGTWKWVDGTPLTEAYWGSPPNNGGGNPAWDEDCAEIFDDRNAELNWNDMQCDNSRNWICENLA